MTVRNKSISVASKTRGRINPYRYSVITKESNRRDVRNLALVPPPHVIRNGFPFVPDYVVASKAVLTTDGSYVPDLTYPWENIFSDDHSRFIAQENMFDDIADKWSPFTSAGIDYYFTWTGSTTPRIEEVEYRIGKRIFPMNSIRIEPAASLISSFNSGLDDASSFMIAMAGIINSSENASLLRVGDTVGSAVEVTVDEYFYVRNQFGTARLTTTQHPAAMVPFYLVLANDLSKSTLYMASGTSRVFRASVPNQVTARSLKIFIGEDVVSTRNLDLNLFEFTLFPYAYGGALTPLMIIEAMADVYGSNS